MHKTNKISHIIRNRKHSANHIPIGKRNTSQPYTNTLLCSFYGCSQTLPRI